MNYCYYMVCECTYVQSLVPSFSSLIFPSQALHFLRLIPGPPLVLLLNLAARYAFFLFSQRTKGLRPVRERQFAWLIVKSPGRA